MARNTKRLLIFLTKHFSLILTNKKDRRSSRRSFIVKRKPRDRRVVEKRLTGEKKSSDVLK